MKSLKCFTELYFFLSSASNIVVFEENADCPKDDRQSDITLWCIKAILMDLTEQGDTRSMLG